MYTTEVIYFSSYAFVIAFSLLTVAFARRQRDRASGCSASARARPTKAPPSADT